ncbi:MAG: SpaH/EbpB family LPXTG-anchored major pilin [Pseudoclavibacter sp.]
MEAKQTRIGRLLAAVLAVLALVIGYGALTATVTPAHAADPSYGNIDQSATGSIIIHKGVENGNTTNGSPDGTAPSGFQGLAGVTFTAYPITSVDLSTNAGWSTVNGWKTTLPAEIANGTACDGTPGAAPSVSGLTFGTPITSGATDGNGLTTISGGVHAYLVCETGSPSTVVDKAQPFIVTIPYPDNNANQSTTPTNGWLYNVNVYPKNGVASISKTVTKQSNLGLGATASFPTTTTVPSIASNAQFTHFWIQDPLDPRLTNGTATLTASGLDSSMYSVEAASSANGNTVTVIFNTAGLTWLKSNPGVQITTTFTGTVSSVGSGTINNKAYLDSATEVATEPPANPTPPDTTPGHDNPGNPDNPNNPSNPNYPGTPSNQVDQNWGDLQLFKQDSGDHSTGLEGASFQVYAASDPYASDCSSATKTGDPITVNNASTFNSQDGTNGTTKGAVSIPGLFVSDSANATVNATQRCYVVVETVAPAGYVLDSTPRGVTVKTGTTASGTYALKIDNSKQAVPGLPLTGAQAQMVLIMLGIALLLAAAGIVLVNRRRRAQRSA